ncbi:MAG: His/Gly/Thr/Pro-type tRNA ligase C-terminal domain-containing protein, partial [Turicibacter sp.]|nr:His/Gly/Thr/Pro-type tRNA ligase C-terminal domain-containing protein [Turicibacter sp.]
KCDLTDKTPGWKFSEYEMKGIPLRVEIGPKDIENNQAVLVRRDTREKIIVSLNEIEIKVAELLEEIQSNLYKKALAKREQMTYVATNMDELKENATNRPGFTKAMWCMDQACEEKIKEEVGFTSRCMPFVQEDISETCVCCAKKAKTMVYWAKAY